MTSRDLDRRLQRRLAVAILSANAVGALIVFVFLSYVVPTPIASDPDEAIRLNLIVFLAFMPLAMALGSILSMRTAPR